MGLASPTPTHEYRGEERTEKDKEADRDVSTEMPASAEAPPHSTDLKSTVPRGIIMLEKVSAKTKSLASKMSRGIRNATERRR